MSLFWVFQRMHCPFSYCSLSCWVNAAKSIVMSPDVQREVISLPLQLKQPLCQYLLIHSYGYIMLKMPELCSKFRVIDVRFIMTLLRWDYSYRLQIIIQELVLKTKRLVPWDMYALMTYSLTFDIGSHHWPLIKIFDWVFDIRSSIHTHEIVLGYIGNHWN